MHNISIISDEIFDNINDVLSFCKQNSLKNIELRSVDGKNLMHHSASTIKIIANKVLRNNLSVSSIASPILKWPHPQKGSAVKNFRAHGFYDRSVDYEKVFEIANLFRVKYIRIFSYLRYKNFKIVN